MRRLYNLYFAQDRTLTKKLYIVLGFVPRQLGLFKLAFFHKSMKNNKDVDEDFNNERLEYLGDSILSAVVAEYLFKKYPMHDEGFLTKMRSKIVKRKSLNSIAEQMGIDIILADYTQGNISSSMLGNAFEAMIGAIYLEKGYRKTKNYIINNILLKYVNIHKLEVTDDNFKSRLLEFCQKEGKSIDFKLMNKYKLDKRDRFKVAVMVDGKPLAYGDDYNKKSAEQAASKLALHSLTS